MESLPPSSQQSDGISVKFGYYPSYRGFKNEQFQLQVLPNVNLGDIGKILRGSYYFDDDWICLNNGRNSRVFSLPKTHELTLFGNRTEEDLDFVVWVLSFFRGIRLATRENGFLDATPIREGELVDFRPFSSDDNIILLALNYIDSIANDYPSDKGSKVRKWVVSAIHTLFLAQTKGNMSFEKFQYCYISLEACYRIVKEKDTSAKIKGEDRIPWLCEKYGIIEPKWAREVYEKRNFHFHEGLFCEEPLGFAVYGSGGNRNVTHEMMMLICRFLVAILCQISHKTSNMDPASLRPEIEYIRSSLDYYVNGGLRLS